MSEFEMCTCGEAATIVYRAERGGDVPHCGDYEAHCALSGELLDDVARRAAEVVKALKAMPANRETERTMFWTRGLLDNAVGMTEDWIRRNA